MSSHDEGISDRDFTRLRTLIYAQSGITLSPDKKTMLELRIKRRLRSLELESYAEYCDYLFGHQGQKDEIVHLLDVVTTNKTDFYREPAHFDFLVGKALPDLMARNPAGRDLLIWSAGCSTGEEPYTLSIVLTSTSSVTQAFDLGAGDGSFHHRARESPPGSVHLRSRESRASGSEKEIFLAWTRSPIQPAPRGPGIAQVSGVPAPEFHGR